jgi:hypothetical protein
MSRSDLNCQRCGKAFHSYSPTPKFCSLQCKAEAMRHMRHAAQIVSLYQGGMTRVEIAATLSITEKVVCNRLRDAGVKGRRAAKRNQSGSANATWVGNAATYSALHHRVEVARGKPKKCDRCGVTKAKRFEWANLTGNYADTSDYVRLCVSCHRRLDARRRAAVGHPTSKHVPRSRREVVRG